ncbi:MAG: M50 family metallopeptidase [Clostridia bacterium]
MSFILAISFLEVAKWIGYILVALLCLMLMITIHELGHYTAGKLFHFKINEFAIGFGPKIFKKENKKTGEIFSIRCIPLGGFCAFAGEDAEVAQEGDFNSKPVWQRIIVLFAGAFFNYLSAIVIISIFFMSFGEFLPQVADVHQFQNGAIQQLQQDDVILKVDGKNTYSLLEPNKLAQLLKNKNEIVITVRRDGEEKDITVTKNDYSYTMTDDDGNTQTKNANGLGISIKYAKEQLPFFQAIGHAFVFGFDVIRVIFTSLGQVFTGKVNVADTMGGTVTAIASLAELTKYGFASVMYGVCVLSSSLAIMNLLPLPALDGSRILFAIIEGIRRKPLNRKVENIIHTVGLVALFALAIILDLLHFFA